MMHHIEEEKIKMSICKKHQAIPCFCDDTEKLIILISEFQEETQKNKEILREIELEKFKQQQLHKSFMKARKIKK